MSKQPESHYNLNSLHFIFAIASLILLFSLGSLFLKDYSRQWKDYQKQFKAYEVEKARTKYDEASHKLESSEEYQFLLKEIKAAQKDFDGKCTNFKNFENEIKTLTTANTLSEQKLKFTNATLDAARFRYEEAKAHDPKHSEKSRQEYEKLLSEATNLKAQVEQSAEAINEKNKTIESCGQQLKDLQRKLKTFTKQTSILERKLGKIDDTKKSLSSQMASLVRDLPVIDLANPSVKIEQIVLADITDDVNFKQVPKVDRCISCHLGISNPDYKNAAQPYRTHPNLELYLGKDSAHPIEEFGCTVCHGGRGRGTGFLSAVHTPSSEEQKKEWTKKYNWQEFHHWEEPMLAKQYVEAGCFKCHAGQETIKGAKKLNFGLALIERAGCYNCHTIDKYKDWPKSGPDLTKLSSKTSAEWIYRWIEDPKSFRHNTWMPAFFDQSNNNDPASHQRGEQEIHAITQFLLANTTEYKKDPIPLVGDVKKGEELVSSIGCFACHQVQPQKTDQARNAENLHREHGPNLIGLGSKTSKEWIYSWLKDPNRYHPQTRMPNLRLSDQEAADIAQYLSEDKAEKFDKKPIAPVNEKIIDDIALDFLKKIDPMQVAVKKLASMNLDQKLVFAGEKLVGHYGCYACHNIKGFESAKPIGAELTEEGSKSASKLDFGFIHIDHSKEAWFMQKLKNPRIFDQGKIKEANDKLIMPNFNFTEEEAEAITTAIVGFTKNKTVVNKIKPRTPENLYIEKGEKIIRQLNCQGCHIISGEGGAIAPSVKEWLKKYDNRDEAKATIMASNFSPPNLEGEGKKVQTQWLFEFLHEPVTIRPWLKVRMPTYSFNASHLNALIKYFNALDKEDFPFMDKANVSLTEEEYKAGQKLFSPDGLDCMKCHVVGNIVPKGDAEVLAPNLALAKNRLKPDWIIKWITNPQDVLPGTKMPTFFDPNDFDNAGPKDILGGDEHEQIRVLRNFLMSLADRPIVVVPEGEKTKEVAPAQPPAPATDKTPAVTSDAK